MIRPIGSSGVKASDTKETILDNDNQRCDILRIYADIQIV